jgi:hypothetical protein
MVQEKIELYRNDGLLTPPTFNGTIRFRAIWAP